MNAHDAVTSVPTHPLTHPPSHQQRRRPQPSSSARRPASPAPSASGGTARTGILGWFRADIDRACAAIVCVVLGAVALAGSATHVLHVGAYPDVRVTGWMVWTVAGSLEVLAAYAAWEVRRRSGVNRLIPAIVLILAVAFIVLANLAAADARSWAAQLPWGEAFAVAPPLSFLSVAAIAETRGWQRPSRRQRTAISLPTARQPAARRRPAGPAARNRPGQPRTGMARGSAATSQRHILSFPAALALATGSDQAPPEPPTARPGEERRETLARWVGEGHTRKSILTAGAEQFGVSESTMKRELQGWPARDS